MSTPENSNTSSPSGPAGCGPDWEAAYQSGDTPWDKGRAHPALLGWLARHPVAGRVLVPGCGPGHDVRALAASPLADVLGFDLAPSAVLAASRYGRAGTERYLAGNFLTGEIPGAPFDWIFEHTCFCAIDPALRSAYVRAAARALRPGGHLLAIFYRNPGHGSGDAPPYGCPMPEVDRLFAPWFATVCEEQDFATFEGREGREVLRLMRRTSAACEVLPDPPQAGQDRDVLAGEP